MAARTAKEVPLGILKRASGLQSLFDTALINREFYCLFKSNELGLMRMALRNDRPEVWELREMNLGLSDPLTEQHLRSLTDHESPLRECSPRDFLTHHASEITIVVELKLLIYRYVPTISQAILEGLTMGDLVNGSEVDEAFWRIWTFCRVFGCRKDFEYDLTGQVDWLRGGPIAHSQCAGNSTKTAYCTPVVPCSPVLAVPPESFGGGNQGGLSQHKVYMMMLIWEHLEQLLMLRSRDCCDELGWSSNTTSTATSASSFNLNPSLLTLDFLVEWVCLIMTFGLAAIHRLVVVCNPVAEAARLGWTEKDYKPWTESRRPFLRAACNNYLHTFTDRSTYWLAI